MSEQLLDVRHLSKTFPGLKALDDVSLSVDSGEVLALVGQNGSGKSTLVKILAGVYHADPGAEIRLAGEGDAGPVSGLHFIHQELGLIGQLSTVENLDLGHELGKRALLPAPVRSERRRARELVGDFGGTFDVSAPVDTLASAERSIVAIARALDGWEHDRNVLILDEPTASLHGDEVDKLFGAVRRVAERGAGVIFISHRLDEVVELADRVTCLRDGRVVADVKRGGYDNDDLVAMIAGSALSAVDGSRAAGATDELVMRADGITSTTIRHLDLKLRAGEILGISGVLGSGREEVAGVLFGARPGQVASCDVAGRVVDRLDPRRAIAAGVAYVPGDRHSAGAVMSMSVRENLTLPDLAPLRGKVSRWLNRGEERAEVDRWIERLEVRPADPERELGLFSGGNQQKVVLAKWLRNSPKVLLLDEPTQGVDVGAKASIYELIADAAATGAGVLVCSSDAKELTMICDRVLVMHDGTQVAEMGRDQLSEALLTRAGLSDAIEESGDPAADPTEVPDNA